MIKPLANKIMLDIKEVKIGAIQSDSIEEHGTIIAVGRNVKHYYADEDKNKPDFPIGATLYFKAWAVDVITEGDKKYYFISADSDAICAIM